MHFLTDHILFLTNHTLIIYPFFIALLCKININAISIIFNKVNLYYTELCSNDLEYPK